MNEFEIQLMKAWVAYATEHHMSRKNPSHIWTAGFMAGWDATMEENLS